MQATGLAVKPAQRGDDSMRTITVPEPSSHTGRAFLSAGCWNFFRGFCFHR
jgi:hypothetical protein